MTWLVSDASVKLMTLLVSDASVKIFTLLVSDASVESFTLLVSDASVTSSYLRSHCGARRVSNLVLLGKRHLADGRRRSESYD